MELIGAFLIGTIINGILGNLIDAVLCKIVGLTGQCLRKAGEPVNHDLQRAVRKAYLLAACALINARLQEVPHRSAEGPWLEEVRKSLLDELKRLPKAAYTPPAPEFEQEIELLLQPTGNRAAERIEQFKTRLKQHLINELQKYGELPPRIEEMIHQGWVGKGGLQLDWFELLCAFFSEEIKENPRVANFLQSQLLAQLVVEGVSIDWKDFSAELDRLSGRILERVEQMSESMERGFAGLHAHLDSRFADQSARIDSGFADQSDLLKIEVSGLHARFDELPSILASILVHRQEATDDLARETEGERLPLEVRQAMAFEVAWLTQLWLHEFESNPDPSRIDVVKDLLKRLDWDQALDRAVEDYFTGNKEDSRQFVSQIAGYLKETDPEARDYLVACRNMWICIDTGDVWQIPDHIQRIEIPTALQEVGADPVAWLNALHDHFESIWRNYMRQHSRETARERLPLEVRQAMAFEVAWFTLLWWAEFKSNSDPSRIVELVYIVKFLLKRLNWEQALGRAVENYFTGNEEDLVQFTAQIAAYCWVYDPEALPYFKAGCDFSLCVLRGDVWQIPDHIQRIQIPTELQEVGAAPVAWLNALHDHFKSIWQNYMRQHSRETEGERLPLEVRQAMAFDAAWFTRLWWAEFKSNPDPSRIVNLIYVVKDLLKQLDWDQALDRAVEDYFTGNKEDLVQFISQITAYCWVYDPEALPYCEAGWNLIRCVVTGEVSEIPDYMQRIEVPTELQEVGADPVAWLEALHDHFKSIWRNYMRQHSRESAGERLPLEVRQAMAFDAAWFIHLWWSEFESNSDPSRIDNSKLSIYILKLLLKRLNWEQALDRAVEDYFTGNKEDSIQFTAQIRAYCWVCDPEAVPYFDAGWNLLLCVLTGEVWEIPDHIQRIEIPTELQEVGAAPDAWLDALHDHFESIWRNYMRQHSRETEGERLPLEVRQAMAFEFAWFTRLWWAEFESNPDPSRIDNSKFLIPILKDLLKLLDWEQALDRAVEDYFTGNKEDLMQFISQIKAYCWVHDPEALSYIDACWNLILCVIRGKVSEIPDYMQIIEVPTALQEVGADPVAWLEALHEHFINIWRNYMRQHSP